MATFANITQYIRVQPHTTNSEQKVLVGFSIFWKRQEIQSVLSK